MKWLYIYGKVTFYLSLQCTWTLIYKRTTTWFFFKKLVTKRRWSQNCVLYYQPNHNSLFWRVYSSKIVINVIIYTFYVRFLFLDVFLNKYVFVTLVRVRCSFVWKSCQTDRQSDRDRRTGVRGACHNIDTCLVETLMLSEGYQRNVGFCLTFYIRHIVL